MRDVTKPVPPDRYTVQAELERLRLERAELAGALIECLGAMTELAARAGDVPEWNQGGRAYEACQRAMRVLRGEGR